MVGRQEAAISDESEANLQRLPVAQYLFCCRVTEIFRQCIVLEQFIMGCDNVLDRGAVLGFLQPQGVDEDALIRNRRSDTFQLRQLAAGHRQRLQNSGRLESAGRKPVESGNGGHKVLRYDYMYRKLEFLYMLYRICIEISDSDMVSRGPTSVWKMPRSSNH